MVGFKVDGFDAEEAQLIIGNNATVGYQCEINVAYKVSIGKNVIIANGVQIFDNNWHPIGAEKRRKRALVGIDDIAPINICNDVWFGIGAIIMKGVKIGEGSVVGAGSIVTSDVPANVLVAGNPARII